MIPPIATQRNIRSSRDRLLAAGGEEPGEAERRAGSTPIPIASDPTAQLPSTRMRCFQYCVTVVPLLATW